MEPPLLHRRLPRPRRRLFHARTDAGPVPVAVGGEATVRVAVHNLDPERRTFTLGAEAAPGWSVRAPFHAVALPSGATADVFFSIRPPGDASAGDRASHRLWIRSGGARPVPILVGSVVRRARREPSLLFQADPS